MREQVAAAEIAARDQPDATCCYARSDKYWITDPQGIAWEHFHTLASIPTFSARAASASDACCPASGARGKTDGVSLKAGTACC